MAQPLTIDTHAHYFPESYIKLIADHAFARHGGRTYSKPEADRALGLTVDFFNKHLKG